MIFFLNSINCGSTKNLGFNPLHNTFLCSVANTPLYLARNMGISNEYYLTSFGENLKLN